MKSKLQKKEEIDKLKKLISSSGVTIFTSFAREGEKGLSVEQTRKLKGILSESSIKYSSAKKTLLEIALRELKYDGADVYNILGSVALATGEGDGYDIAKRIYEFSRKNTSLKLFGGFVDGTFVNEDGVLQMALMPSREVLLARLFGMIQYPVRGLAIVLSQVAMKKEATA